MRSVKSRNAMPKETTGASRRGKRLEYCCSMGVVVYRKALMRLQSVDSTRREI